MTIEELTQLGLELLDRQLVDPDGTLCGKVDDIRLEMRGGDAVLSAILSGPGAWPDRLPRLLRRIARAILSRNVVAVPLSEVRSVDGAVHLKRRARDLGLGLGEDQAARWLRWLPGAHAGDGR